MPKKSKEILDPTPTPPQHTLSVYLFSAALTLIASLAFWLALSGTLFAPFETIQGARSIYWNEIGLIIVSYATIFTMIVFTSALIKDFRVRLAIFTLIPLSVWILVPQFVVVIPLSVLMLCGILLVDYLCHKDIRNQIVPNLRQTYMTRLSWVSTVFALVIALLFYNSGSSNLTNVNLNVPTEFFDQAANLSRPILEDQIKQQQVNLMNRIIDQVETQFPSLKEVPFQDKQELLKGNITQPVREALLSQGFSETQINQIALQLKENVPSETTQPQVNLIDETIERAKLELQGFVNKFIAQNINIIPWLLSAFIFLFFNFFGLVFNLIAVGFTLLFIRILLRFGWIKIETRDVKAQEYTIA